MVCGEGGAGRQETLETQGEGEPLIGDGLQVVLWSEGLTEGGRRMQDGGALMGLQRETNTKHKTQNTKDRWTKGKEKTEK